MGAFLIKNSGKWNILGYKEFKARVQVLLN